MATVVGNFGTFATAALGGNAFTWDSATVDELQLSDDVYAALQGPFLGGTTGYTNYIKVTAPQTTIPANATSIDEIRIKVERGAGNALDTHVDRNLHLVINGTIETSINKADTVTNWDAETTITYTFTGGNLVALGLSVAEARAADFGVAFAQTYNTGDLNSPSFEIDRISYEMDYTPGPDDPRRRYNAVMVL